MSGQRLSLLHLRPGRGWGRAEVGVLVPALEGLRAGAEAGDLVQKLRVFKRRLRSGRGWGLGAEAEGLQAEAESGQRLGLRLGS